VARRSPRIESDQGRCPVENALPQAYRYGRGADRDARETF